MFIIWGTRQFQKLMGYARQYTCRNCGNVSAWQVIRTMRWFTLFFIPIFPFSVKYFVLCPVCQHGAQVGKETGMQELEAGTQPTQQASLDE